MLPVFMYFIFEMTMLFIQMFDFINNLSFLPSHLGRVHSNA